MKYLNIIFVFIIISSCSNYYNKSRLLKQFEEITKIKLPNDNVEIKEYESSASIGDYTESYIIVLKDEDFNNIFNGLDKDKMSEYKPNIFSKEIKIDDNETYYLMFDKKRKHIRYVFVEL